jgi:hypothetical protein
MTACSSKTKSLPDVISRGIGKIEGPSAAAGLGHKAKIAYPAAAAMTHTFSN